MAQTCASRSKSPNIVPNEVVLVHTEVELSLRNLFGREEGTTNSSTVTFRLKMQPDPTEFPPESFRMKEFKNPQIKQGFRSSLEDEEEDPSFFGTSEQILM